LYLLQQGALAMKKLNKKQIKEIDWRLTQPITSEELDEERAIAWGSYMGMMLGDFLKIIDNYCEDRGRKYFVAMNEWGSPTVHFDAESNEELQAQWKKEREEIRKLHGLGDVEQTRLFANPRKTN
jgi:hypothetical protein